MRFASCLDGGSEPLLFDASVILNINATGAAELILRSLPHDVLVTQAVLEELERGAQMAGHEDASQLRRLISKGIVREVELSLSAKQTYYGLVAGGSLDTLGDGEAATVAFASESEVWAVIDERKALRICRDSFPQVKAASSIDVFAHAHVSSQIPQDALGNMVFHALRKARMRVREDQFEWVARLIGRSRLGECPSLSRYLRRGAA